MGVEVFVAAVGQRDELVAQPDFDAGPVDRIEVDLDDDAVEMDGDFPGLAAQGDGGVLAHAAVDAHEEEAREIGVRRQGAQGDAGLGKALGGGLLLEGGVRTLVIVGLDPAPEGAVEVLERGGGLEVQLGLELILDGEEEAFDLAAAPTVIGAGVEEFDAEIGADDLEVLGTEGGAVVGVELVGEAAGADRLAQAIQEAFEAFGGVELAVDAEVGPYMASAIQSRLGRGSSKALVGPPTRAAPARRLRRSKPAWARRRWRVL